MSTTKPPKGQPVSATQKALTYGLGALAIGGAARHTYKHIRQKQAAAQRRADRDYRVARGRALRDMSTAMEADEYHTARRMHQIPTPGGQRDIPEPYSEAEILRRIATRPRPHAREAATLLLNREL